jgi:TIR domain
MKHDVFISYSRSDADWARKLEDALAREGLRVFLDEKRLQAGVNWEDALDGALLTSRNLVVLWSDSAAQSHWVSREVETFRSLRRLGGSQAAGSDRRVIFVNLAGENTAYGSIQRIDDLRPAVAGGADADSIQAGVWSAAVRKVVTAVRGADSRLPIPLAILAMNEEEMRHVAPDDEGGIEKRFDETVRDLGFSLDGNGAPGLGECYGPRFDHWSPFGGDPTIQVILDDILLAVNRQLRKVKVEYRWESVDLMSSSIPETRNRVADLAAGPAVVVVDALSLYDRDIKTRYGLLDRCRQNEDALIAVVTPVPRRDAAEAMRQLVRNLASPLAEPYFDPPMPRQPQFAVGVGDAGEMDRLVRSCIGGFLGKSQKRRSVAYLRAS